MFGRLTIAIGVALLLCPAALPAAAPAKRTAPRLLHADFVLPEGRRAGDHSRWLLPEVAESYESDEPKPRLRIRGKKIKWSMPLD